jgi:hypothetical protein
MPQYSPYAKKFKDIFGVDYAKMENSYLPIAGTVGVYPDSSFLLYQLATHDTINTIVEFGAGMSTCVLNDACTKAGKQFMSVESSTVWSDNVHKALQLLGSTNRPVISTEETKSLPELLSPLDFLWVDGHILNVDDRLVGRIDACKHYESNLQETLLVFDDAQWFSEKITDWLSSRPSSGKSTEMWYNPTGRADRHQFISVPESKRFAVDLILEGGGCVA